MYILSTKISSFPISRQPPPKETPPPRNLRRMRRGIFLPPNRRHAHPNAWPASSPCSIYPTNEIIHPLNGLVNRDADRQLALCRSVELVPAFAFRHHCRPSLSLAIGKQTYDNPPSLDNIDVTAREYQLEINQIVRAFATWLADSVQLLRNLILQRHQGNRLRQREAQRLEHLNNRSVNERLGMLCIADFIVSDLKIDGTPRGIPILKPKFQTAG